MFLKLLAIIVVSGKLTVMAEGLNIVEVSAEDDTAEVASTTASTTTTIAHSSVAETSYRQSVPKIEETPYRVPEHLQIVPQSMIYENSDDVIHVIDPPKQFEELKKIMQLQEQRRLENPRPPVALREQRPMAKIRKTVLPAAKHIVESVQAKPSPAYDMQTQEAHPLPLEILASVRKTENFLRKYKPKFPAARHRLKTHKIQTVLWEHGHDNQQFQQGQEQRVQGVKEQLVNRRRFIKKRFKREAHTQGDKQLKGVQLLNHLNELIKNASFYLNQTENSADYRDVDREDTTLQREILVETNTNTRATTTDPLSRSSALNEEMIGKILENSVKATTAIMQQIKVKANLTTITEKCDHLKVTYPNHIQNLQNQITCMKNFIKDINQTGSKEEMQKQNNPQPKESKKSGKSYRDRLEARQARGHANHKPFLVAQLTADYIDNSTPSLVNSTLIYDDVMTTIRNMLQSENLQSIDEAGARAWQSSSFVYDKSSEPVNYDNLQEYLTSLQEIVTNLPKFNYKTLNLQEIEGGSTSKYYFINPQGSIYSLPQPFQKDVIPTAPTAIFHQFPDLPLVRKQFLKNGTLLPPPSSKVVEIL